MATHNLEAFVFTYNQVNKGKYKSVRHYEEVTGNTRHFKYVNISENRNFAKSKPEFWFKVRNGKKWGKPLTGLFKTDYPNIYKGDLQKRTHLILFQFLENGDKLKIVVFNQFFTPHINPLIEQYFR